MQRHRIDNKYERIRAIEVIWRVTSRLMNPRVSVVIPSYNSAITISSAIDSVLAQSYDNIEIIVVNDASTDNTAQVLENYGSEIKCVSHENNQGGAAARNTGIMVASGEYIAFLDADDEWLPEKLASQVSELERRSDDWIAAYCGFKHVRTNIVANSISDFFRRSSGLEGNSAVMRRILSLQFDFGGSSSLIVDTDIIEKVNGFDPDFQRHQDFEFLIRVLEHGQLAYVPELGVRKRASGVPPSKEVFNSKIRLFNKFPSLISELYFQGEDVLAYHRFDLAKNLLYNGHISLGFKTLWGATPPETRDIFSLINALLVGVFKNRSE